MSEMPDRIPVTSLLNRLLADAAFADTAVVVNEFGAVGIDGDLVEKADDRAFVMTTGCLCCTVEGDIRLTLLRLAEDAVTGRGPAFARLAIETTGLADPAPVLQSLMTSELVIDRYALNGVVTVIDATAGDATLDRFPEARAQAAVADLLLMSKTDLAAPSATARLRTRLAALAPNAPVRDAAATDAPDVFGLGALDPALKPPEVAAWLRFAPRHGHHDHDHDPNRHGEDITAFCFTGSEPVNPWDVQDALEAMRTALGPDLLRLKAIACLDEDPERPVILHAVQQILHPPARLDRWPDGPRATRLIVIARGPHRDAVPAAIARHLPQLAAWQGQAMA
jgi:G3E family GTPase